jgi:hypothetical protein
VVALPKWFVSPPPVGSQSPSWLVLEATTQKQFEQYVTNGLAGPYATKQDAQNVADAREKNAEKTIPDVPNPLTSWLTGLGGDIGSGIEAGFVALLQDVWNVILGPLEIIAGVLLAIVILLWIFKDDLATIGRLIP